MTITAVTPTRVAIVGDFDLVVAGVAGVLAPFSEQVTFLGRSTPPSTPDADVLLYDTRLQPRGHALTLELLRHRTTAAIVVFTWDLDVGSVNRSMASGARGHISKKTTGPQLLAAVDQAHRAATQPPAILADVGAGWCGQQHGLTQRESEVMALITRGHSNLEIATTCHLSINSVKTYIRTGYRKVGVTRRAQAVRWAIEHGFAVDTLDHLSEPAPARVRNP